MNTTGSRLNAAKWPLISALLLIILAALVLLSPSLRDAVRPGEAGQRDGSQAQEATLASFTTTSLSASAVGPPYLTGVSANGRYFLDQYGAPFLVKGDAPWALMTRLSADQARLWFANRQGYGYNTAVVSLIGTTANGGPADDGATYDGIRPFIGSDVTRWNSTYWQRAHDYVRFAAERGITVLLYPIDGWTIGKSFSPTSFDQCRSYGASVADHFRDLPNIVWMSGGDYYPTNRDATTGSNADKCITAMVDGIRSRGDNRLFSIQLGYPKELSTDDPYWAPRIRWNFSYSYSPAYRDVLRGYDQIPARPVVMGESNYEGENLDPDSKPTTVQSLRRQVLWSLTSGAAGDIAGSRDWKFDAGWERRLDSAAVAQISMIRRLASTGPWWELVPDRALITWGWGTPLANDSEADVLDNDFATAARSTDGRRAVLYVPTARTMGLDLSRMRSGARGSWIDPTTGRSRAMSLSATVTTPGPNAAGDQDWILLLTAP